MKITRQTWKDLAGLRQRGLQVRKGETSAVDEFNKVQYFNQCVRNQDEQARISMWQGFVWRKGC